MKKLIAFLLSVVLVCFTAACSSDSSAAKIEITDEVKTQLDTVLSDNGFKGIVSLTQKGQTIYQYVNGNDDNDKPLAIDASMPIGSVSKQFCAACIMLLCDQNKLSIDDTLEKYFPEYQYGKKMTIKNLLNMSSGISNYLELVDPSTMGTNEEDNVSIIKNAIFNEELRFEPGNDYAYSNSNYFLLAEIVEQVSGVPYHEFLRKNFFEPFEMMDKWMHGLSSGKVISSDAFRQMTQDANPESGEEYCYGFWHMPYGGAGHVGQIPPHFGAVDYINTDRDVYLFAVSNTGRGMSYVQVLPQALLSVIFEEEATSVS